MEVGGAGLWCSFRIGVLKQERRSGEIRQKLILYLSRSELASQFQDTYVPCVDSYLISM